MLIRLGLHRGRKVHATVEHDPKLGRSFYRFGFGPGSSSIGTITIEPIEGYGGKEGPDDRYSSDQVQVHWGLVTSPGWVSYYHRLKEAGEPFGVKLTGGWVFSPSQVRTSPGWDWMGGPIASARRYLGPCCSENAPDGTRKLMGEVAVAVAEHWLATAEYPSLCEAWLRREAPGRLAEHRREIHRLMEEAEKIQQQLAVQRAFADVQAAIVEPELAALAAEPSCLPSGRRPRRAGLGGRAGRARISA